MSLHVPERARVPAKPTFERSDVLADALGEVDHGYLFADDPRGWRLALQELISETDAEIANLNGIRAASRYRNRDTMDAAAKRATWVERKTALEARVRYVKLLAPPRNPGVSTAPGRVPIDQFDGNKFEQAQAHIRAANRLLKEWAAETGYTRPEVLP